ncbi:MAG TPA: hypothetical protein VFU80_01285 [Sphingomicrobium sp.]|nr:hypothetical protein [Sphingomicrobium sp.]
MKRLVLSGASALVLFPVLAAAYEPRPARPAAFEKHAEFDCNWRAKGASIGRGEQSPVLSIVDPKFESWSDNEDHAIELSAGGGSDRVEALSYVIHSAEKGSTLAIFLDAAARSVVGGARQLQIWKGGKPVLDLAFANTPSAEDLAACVSEGD